MNNRNIILAASFLTALLVANVSGPQYVYPTFGPSLANRFHWSSIENSVVGTSVFVGVSFSGPLCAYLVENYGFRITLTISAFITSICTFLLAATYQDRLPSSYILCAFYLVCMGASSAAAYICTLDSQAYNFKLYRGMSMGLTSASLGISGLVFSQINDKLFKPKGDQDGHDNSTFEFLIFFGCTAAAVTFLGSFILGPIEHTKHKLSLMEQQPLVASNSANYASTAGSVYSFSTSSTQYEEEAQDAKGAPSKNVINYPKNIQIEDEEINLSGLIVFLDPIGFSLCLSLLIILGLGYVYLTNIGGLLISLSADRLTPNEAQHLRNLHISVFSVSNCVSRAVFGTLSDIFQRRIGIHRMWFIWFAAVGLMTSMVSLPISVSSDKDLMAYSVAIAIVYGIVFAIAPAIISEFGIKTFARNWGWMLCAPAIGSQLFNLVFGIVYDRELSRQGGQVCHGMACFKNTFITGAIAAGLCLFIITSAIYRKGIYRLQSTSN
ncbi:hypothetical protein RMATCC62417_17493 [Rhizopus microsporus]|nr:hypothetical protein RMATCC62417_17493 [Rhizopus microsporus]